MQPPTSFLYPPMECPCGMQETGESYDGRPVRDHVPLCPWMAGARAAQAHRDVQEIAREIDHAEEELAALALRLKNLRAQKKEAARAAKDRAATASRLKAAWQGPGRTWGPRAPRDPPTPRG